MTPATAVRLFHATKAMLNLVAKRDHRIMNRNAWGDGLAGISENYASRNVQRLANDEVRAVVAASHAIDRALGRYVEVLAETGARLSQVARLQVGDLQDGAAPRLMIPSSRKGRGRKPGRAPVPITAQLAAKLDEVNIGRPADAPLLLRSDGRAWQSSNRGDHAKLYAKAARTVGVAGTIYALRHSSIVRSLIAGVPIRVVAAMHDTSVPMIERTYSSFITEFADEVARRGLVSFGEEEAVKLTETGTAETSRPLTPSQ
jgi:integrase